MTATNLYGGQFDAANRNNPRTIIGHWVADGATVLEVGPGDGVISRWLKTVKGCRTIGVEYVPQAATRARDAFDDLLIGSIEDQAVLAALQASAPFDDIIFADVLEHLVDPWNVLRQMRPLLAPQGHVLLSMPNVAHWTVRLNLLRGRFDYTDGYLMDRTHLRWFTFRTACELAQQAGYRVVDQAAVFKPRFMRFWRAFNGYQVVLNLMAA
jgi:2-polyprenyl-3-methyl-5-hydroxy-6-metoxy-1,4-benzoquinol methylase